MQFRQRCPEDRTPLMSLPGWLSALLRARGVNTDEKARRFLSPSLDQLHDPFLMQDMDRAVSQIRGAVSAKKRILVYGDYDVDGICASVILLEGLRELGADADFRIPQRHSEGYGLNEQAVREIASDFQMLITVDCGITSVKEVALARSLGMTVIVTDHHEPPETLPEADAVLNPLLGQYPFRRLCGAGVALKVCQALYGLSGIEKWLDVASLATVADIVPLADENRIIVREGMLRMAFSKRPGLQALMAGAGVHTPVRSEDLAFRLAPRLNAAGRLGDASVGVHLLMTRKEEEARTIAARLEENNRLRQEEERRLLEEALPQAEKTCFREERVIIVQGEGWNSGLIGLVAGKICEKYHFPTIALSLQGDQAVGSCRSIPGVNIHQALSRCADLFLRFGGHAQAAGLTIPTGLISELRRRLNLILREQADDALFIPCREYDLAVSFRNLSLETVEQLNALEPTGFGNPAPVFLTDDVSAQEMRRVGKDHSHLKVRLLDQSGTVMDGIGFSQGDAADRGYDRVNVLYAPARNEFNGRVSVQLMVQALQPAPGSLRLPGEAALFHGLLQEISLVSAKETGILPSRISRKRMLHLLKQPMGTLVLTRQGKLAHELAAETGADIFTDRVSDPRGFSSILCGWDPHKLKNQWQTVILADGWSIPGEADWLHQVCPAAELLAVSSPADQAALCETLRLSDDTLRDLYRHIRASSFPSLEALARAAGLSWRQVMVGLVAFDDTALVSWQPEPFSLRLLPPQKCRMEDSPLIHAIRHNHWG